MEKTLLLVGLGNPGKEYEKTRHNIGWMFLDYLKNLPESNFEEWKEKKKLGAFISEGTLHASFRDSAKPASPPASPNRDESQGGQSHSSRVNKIATLLRRRARDDDLPRYILAKPTTFMNNSGLTVQKLVTRYLPRLASSKAGALRVTRYVDDLIVAHDDIDIPFGEFKIQTNRGSAGHHGVESIIEHLGTRNFKRMRIGIASEIRKKAGDYVLKKFSSHELKNLQEVFSTIANQFFP